MRKRYLFSIIILTVLLVVLFAYRGLRADSRITIDKLRGLTPNEVISRLGQPDVDPRTGGWSMADQANGNPLALIYEQQGSWVGREYAIIFRDNKVVEIRTGTK